MEMIKTNGDQDKACKNLRFVRDIGFLRDDKKTIAAVCREGSKDAPSLPAATVQSVPPENDPGIASELKGRVLDIETEAPIEGVTITLTSEAPLEFRQKLMGHILWISEVPTLMS